MEIQTAVSSVTLYPDRARVTRTGTVDVTPEIRHLFIEELPLTMDIDSVRVAGQGTAKVRILGVDVRQRNYTVTPASNIQALEEQIETLLDELKAIEDEKTSWNAQAHYLSGLRESTREFARGLSRGQTTVQEQATLLAFLHEQETAVKTAVRDLNIQQRTRTREVNKLKRDLKQNQSARPLRRHQAKIEVEIVNAGNFEAQLTYVVHGASWSPLYDVRFNQNNLTLEAIAQISQNSGEDWPDVQLAVSTARPALNQRLPELHTWYIDHFRPRPPAAPMMSKSAMSVRGMMEEESEADMDDMMMMADEMPMPKMERAEAVVAHVESSGTAVTFQLPSTSTIPSDGSPHKAVISRTELPTQIDYLSVPKHTDAVFRRLTIDNTGEAPLLAGSANLFVDDEYIGRTHIQYTPVGDEIELLLGVEERITVSRELVKRDVDKRFLRDNRQLRYGYEIKMKNLLETAVHIELHDHIPVSRHEQIKVKLEKAVPDITEHSDLNLLKWKLTLATQAERTIMYEYLVEHPRSLQVQGLEN